MSIRRHEPDRLVENGRVHFGRFSGPLQHANLIDAKPWPGCPVPRPLRYLRLKEWQAFQITHPRFFIVTALFDAKFVSLVQMKLYDRQTGAKYMLEKQLLPHRLRIPDNILNSVCVWEQGDEFVRFDNRLNEGFIGVQFNVGASKDMPALTADLRANAQAVDPMVVSIPFGQNHGMYSHKALLPVVGTLTIGDEQIDVQPHTASLMTDDHKGYYGRIMNWDWVVGAQWRGEQLCGFNLTRNASIDPYTYNENGFWQDGHLHALPPVKFERTGEGDGSVWWIRDRDGLVDVRFDVEKDGRLFANYGVIESRYLGPFGTYQGTLRSLDGAKLRVDGMFGMGERFWLKV